MLRPSKGKKCLTEQYWDGEKFMENLNLSEETLKDEIAKAREAVAYSDASEPRAQSAYYDANCDRVSKSTGHKISLSLAEC